MLNQIHNRGLMTHMPFLAPWPGGERVLFFCCADKSRVWKLMYEKNNEQHRIETGLSDATLECSPTAWYDSAGWHVSFVGGFAPDDRRYYLYRMDGPSLDKLSPPESIVHTSTGFVYGNRVVFGERSTIHIIDDTIEREIKIPNSHFYRISYRPDYPDKLLISIHDEITDDIYVVEHDLQTGEQHKIECDGKAAYKCAILGNEIFYADKSGIGFEERKIVTGQSVVRQFIGKIIPARVETNPDTDPIGKKRFEVCKSCSQSTDSGFGCKHYAGCCFGRWRSQPENKCPEGKW